MEDKEVKKEYDDPEMEKTWRQFRNSIVNKDVKGNKKFKVSGSWGIYDAYKLIRKNKWYDIGRPVKEKEFYAIIRHMNNLYADKIAKGYTVHFPCKMGKLELRKEQRGVFIDEKGNMKITYPVDWHETLKLWFEDPEARSQKLLIRRNSKCVYRVHFNKYNATFNNKLFYEFTLNRFIKKKLKHYINNGLIDTIYGKEYSIHKYQTNTR